MYLIAMYPRPYLIWVNARETYYFCWFLFTPHPNVAVPQHISSLPAVPVPRPRKYSFQKPFCERPINGIISRRMPFPPVHFVFVYTSITSPPSRPMSTCPAFCDCGRIGAETPDPTDETCPTSLPTPSIHNRSHQTWCSIPTYIPTLGADGEGIKNFWGTSVPCMDAYAVETAWAFSAPPLPTRELPAGRRLPFGDFHANGRFVERLRMQHTHELRHMLVHASSYHTLQHGRATLRKIEAQLAFAHRRLTALVPLHAKCALPDGSAVEDANGELRPRKMLKF
ncbi:hypothetical protein B0H14DRAFT_2655928 [Mycena olivaceomarginata]|nr:hypothetical protein B0H14DRAFT_2655928 [Mycena olivaceomarginata]